MRIDARMLGFSGIGVVIENVLKRMILMHPELRFHVLVNSKTNVNHDWLSAKNVHVSSWEVSIYSVEQQIVSVPVCPFEVAVTWCPHYDVSRQLKGPLLVTIHDVLHLDRNIMKRSVVQKVYAQLMMRYTKKRADRIIFVSEFTRSQFDRFIGVQGVDSRVYWLGVDPKWFKINWTPKSDKDRYAIFVGNAMVHKNLKTLIRTIVKYGGIKLVIVGNAAGLKTLDQESVELAAKYSDLIEVTGRIDDQRLKDIMAGASLLVSPSLYEGFGLTPLEAMAAGVPVAISDIPVHRELYDGVAQFFDPLSESQLIDAVLRSLDGSCEAALDRKAFARGFDWNDVAEKYLASLLELADHGSGK